MSELRIYRPDECGPDGYPFAWHQTIKHQVRADAGNRCIRCGHPYRNGEHGNGEWSPCGESCVHGGPIRHLTMNGPIEVHAREGARIGLLEATRKGRVEARWRILTVHHLNGVKHDCRWWNLAALCQRCHLTIQGRVQMERVWPWEHSEWFRPHAAGWYAFAYLDEDITREEAVERMDELLALERAA